MKSQCPICKGQSVKYLTAKDYNQKLSTNEFYYYVCGLCSLVYINPVPEELQSYYTQDYPAYQMPTLQELEKKTAAEKYKLEILNRFAVKGRLLEIGPSFGGFAYLAKAAGYEVVTVEMDESCCRFLSDVVGVKAINSSDTADAVRTLGQFDVVVMWHVLEHLVTPVNVLEAVAESLSPGGVFILTTPNPSSLQFKVFKQYWTHLDAPRHLYLVPAKLLTEQMNKLGLMVENITTSDQASTIFSTFGWWCVSLMNYIQSKNLTFGTLFYKKAIKSVLRVMYFLLFRLLERREGYGCAYTAVYKKPKQSSKV